MNEWQELKAKLLEIGLLLGRLLGGGKTARRRYISVDEVSRSVAGGSPKRRRRRHRRVRRSRAGADLFIQAGVGSLLTGVITGFVVMKLILLVPSAGPGGILSEAMQLGGALLGSGQTDSTRSLLSFEDEEDLKKWVRIRTRLSLSGEQIADGRHSVRVSFLPGPEDFQAIVRDDLVRSGKKYSDWTGFSAFQVSIANPNPEPAVLELMITDTGGRVFKEELKLPRKNAARLLIPFSRIGKEIRLDRVNQISFYARMKTETAFYLDDVRLVGALAQTASSAVRSTASMPAVQPMPAGVNPFDWGFAARKAAWTRPDPQTGGSMVQIPFLVRNETPALCWLCPVEGGVPLPRGEVTSLLNLRLRSPRGEDWPFQPRVLESWPDGSIRWVGIHSEATLPPGQEAGFFLEYGPEVRSMEFPSALEIRDGADFFRIRTGPLQVVLNRKTFTLFEDVWMDVNGNKEYAENEKIVHRATLHLEWMGQSFRTDLAPEGYRLTLEEQGTQRAVFRAEGWFASDSGTRYCRMIVRYYFYQGKNFVKVVPTFIYTGYPANLVYEPTRSSKLPANETVDALTVRIPYALISQGQERQTIGFGGRLPLIRPGTDPVQAFQKTWRESSVTAGGRTQAGPVPLAGWFDISNPLHGLAVTVRDFRENFPKAFAADPAAKVLEVSLWPKEAGPLDLQTTEKAAGPDAAARGSAYGLGKTHELLFHFHGGSPAEVKDRAVSFGRRMIVRTNPYWTDAAGTLGRLFPVEAAYKSPEAMLSRLFDWAARWPERYEWYGMLNFGDTLTWYRSEDEDGKYTEPGWHPAGRWGWYNCEGPGTHTGALLQFARSGEFKYFRFGENLARHLMDVDTIHYNTIAEDPRLKKILDDQLSRPGSMHRHNGDHWGGRTDEASHTNVAGLLLYYQLTGDERALEVARETGEFFLQEPFTYMGHDDEAPQRGLANALWGDVLLYQTTRDERYKKAADKLAAIFLKGQQEDGSFLETYNPQDGSWRGDKHGLYMSWYDVSAFIAYHQLTQDDKVLKMLLALLDYLKGDAYSADAVTHGFAYAYFMTRDPKWVALADAALQDLMKHASRSSDAMLDGQIFEKPIYHRPNIFLATVPYVFGALDEDFRLKRSAARS